MKISCLQENLKNSIGVVERIIGQNTSLPILSKILLNAEENQLKISATNLEIGIITWLPGKTDKKGEACINAKIISGFVNNLSNGKINIEKKDNILIIQKDGYSAEIITGDEKNFPIIPKIKTNKKIKIKQKELKDGLDKTINSVATSDLKPEITGIYFNFKKNILKLAATDSFRLSEKQIVLEDIPENIDNFILPQKTAQELIRLLKNDGDIVLMVDKNQIFFDFDNIQIFSKLIDGQYPEYEQIIPKNFKTKTIIEKQEFLNVLKIASVFCGKTNDIKIKISQNKITVTSRDTEKGENKNEIPAKTDGPEVETIFNYKYLIDGLNNLNNKDVILFFNEKNTPAMVLGAETRGCLYIIMPIRFV